MPRFYESPEPPDPLPPNFYEPSAAGIYWPYAPYIPDPSLQQPDDPGHSPLFRSLLNNPMLAQLLLRGRGR